MEKKYTSLKKLVGKEFRVEKVWGYKWKMYLPAENRFTVSDTYQEGHAKKYQIETSEGELEVSEYQFGQMLASAYDFKTQGTDITGMQFAVKSNGKEGMEIRYYINPVRSKPIEPKPRKEVVLTDIEDTVDLNEIPF